MCFTRKPYDKVRANIAKEDIFAYKWLKRDRKLKTLKSPYEDFQWKQGEVYTEKRFSEEVADRESNIYRGFHSLLSIKHATVFAVLAISLRNCHLYKVCIPKGSLYYINDSQIVSNKCYLVDDKAVRIRKK